jgi:hypothetical protein
MGTVWCRGPAPRSAGDGQGMLFDGGNDYVDVEDNDAYSITTTNKLTVALWVNAKKFSPRGRPIGKAFGREFEWDIWVNTDGTFQAFMWNTAIGTYLSATSAAKKTNQWYHLVMLADASSPSLRIYVDGVLEATATNPSGTLGGNGSGNLTIGVNATVEFNGLIDDVRIYNRALSADEIKRLYNMGR